MTSRFVRCRKSASTCGARSAMISTGSSGACPMSTSTDGAVGLDDAADERERPVHPLVVLQAAVRDRVEQRDVEALAERPRLQLEVHRVVVRVDDPRAARHRVAADDERGNRPVAVHGVPPRARPHVGLAPATRGHRRKPRASSERRRFAHERPLALRAADELLEIVAEAHHLVALRRRQLRPDRTGRPAQRPAQASDA